MEKRGKYIRTKEWIENNKHIQKGKTHSPETTFKKGSKPWNTGKKLPGWMRDKISKKLTGVKQSNISGDKHPNWQGGITKASLKIRGSIEYKLWRRSVYERDGYKCIWCGKGSNLNADHIKPFAYYPELRFAIDNGRTLCVECHKTTDTYLFKALKHK